MKHTRIVAIVLALIAGVVSWRMATAALDFNEELQIGYPALAREAPIIPDPKTPRLARRVFLVVVDGLGLAESHLPALDALRARGIAGAASSHYPTVSRPNYITILTGVPPVASGVRANRVRYEIRLDSIMHRVKEGGLVVDTASDIGAIPSLFEPPPFDRVLRGETTEELEPLLLDLAATSKPGLVFVLAGDVDRSGHKAGVGEDYRAAAARVDAMIGKLAAAIDLSQDAIVVTADHGHVARGGHGGDEPDAASVPLVIAGAGVIPNAQLANAKLADIAPTVAALLGVAAPGHGYGRTLLEILRLDERAMIARTVFDAARLDHVAAAPVDERGPRSLLFVAIALGSFLAIGLTYRLHQKELVAIALRPYGVIAFVAILVALFAITRGHLSPSFVPPLTRFQKLIAICGIAAIGLQVIVTWRVVRGRADRLAAANGLALVGLAVALVPTLLVRAWFAPPYVEVPEPAWLVAIPGLALATGIAAAAIFAQLGLELVASFLRRPDV